VSVYTGDIFGAGTDANVYIIFVGEIGETGELAICMHSDSFISKTSLIFAVGWMYKSSAAAQMAAQCYSRPRLVVQDIEILFIPYHRVTYLVSCRQISD